MGGTEGGKDLPSSCFGRPPYAASVGRKDFKELAGPGLSSPNCLFTVHYVPCCGKLVPMYKKKQNKITFALTMSYFAFHPRCVSVLVHLQCHLLLSGFLKLYRVFIAAGEAKANINAIKEH